MKMMITVKKKKPFLVGGAPFSGFYTGFYFVPLYALEQMYYGVSPKSRYFGFNYLIKVNSFFFEEIYETRYKFYPKPNQHISKKFFSYYINGWLGGKENFCGFKPGTFFYDFFLGFFLFMIWQLGGGFRISPLYDPTKKLNVFGFFDLRFTPLAVIFKYFVNLAFFFGFVKFSLIADYYFFNKRSLSRGFLIPYFTHELKYWGKRCDIINFVILPSLLLIPELFAITLFHFFLRPLVYFYISFMGGLFSVYENKIGLFDHFWIQLYAYYMEEICLILRIRRIEVYYGLRLKHVSLISTFFYIQSIVFSKYWKRKFYKIFSIYGLSEIIFSFKFSNGLYINLESNKINRFKKTIYYDSIKSTKPVDVKFLPKIGFFFKSHFFRSYIYKPFASYWGYQSIKILKKFSLFKNFNPFFNKLYTTRFYSPIYVVVQWLIKINNPQNRRLYPTLFRTYKYRTYWFKDHFEELRPYRLFYILTCQKEVINILIRAVRKVSIFMGYIWIAVKSFGFFNKIVYLNNVRFEPYRSYLKKTTLSSYFFIFRVLGYFPWSWFGPLGFNIYQNVLIKLIFIIKTTIKFFYAVFKKIVLFVYGWYSYIFWTTFRPVFTIFFFFYLEIRYFFIFIVELARFFNFYKFQFYYYSIFEAYYVSFRKFFIGSKFFRFFTREIGEDLEETLYNNDQDLKNDQIADYLSDFPAYEDFQSSYQDYDQGYKDYDFQNFIQDSSYYDYWFSNSTLVDQNTPIKSNLEFFAENYFESENDLIFQIFCVWGSPTLFDFRDNITAVPPYFYKDKVDATTSAKARDWYPLELTQPVAYEEDHIEYYLDSGQDEMEISETSSINIIPFDLDRARLAQFSTHYRNKLALWHSYQVANNFSKLPEALKFMPLPSTAIPTNLSHWKEATKALSTIFFTPKQQKNLSFKFESFDQLQDVWSRISYEIDRNPQKFYDFLMDSKNHKIFDKLDFEKKSSFSLNYFTKFFVVNSSVNSYNFIRYLDDYFNGYVDSSQIGFNKFYAPKNIYHNLFVIAYLDYMAKFNNREFMKKFWLLSQFKQFEQFSRAFGFYTKYKSNLAKERSNPTFVEEIYASRVSLKLSQNFSPVPTNEYWNDDDGIFLWIIPRGIRPRLKNWLLNNKLSKEFKQIVIAINKLRKRKGKKSVKLKYFAKKLNKNDLFQVFITWCRHEQKILFWKFAGRGNRDHYYYKRYTKEDKLKNVAFENLFTAFLFDTFSNIKYTINKLQSLYSAFLFRYYAPSSIFFYYTDGEDDSILIRDRDYRSRFSRNRAHFPFSQVIQGAVWSNLNPKLEELFYEIYYINTNIFFPSAFTDQYYSDFLLDDHRDSGLDIYDEYIFIGGIKEFDRNAGEGAEDLIVSPDEYGDEDTETFENADESNWRSDEWIDFDSSADEGIADGDETGGENSVHYIERFYYNSDWFFFSEHIDSDEGLEEWEPDELDSTYDLDQSIDRFFWGGLKRKNHFPATDQRIFFGTLDSGVTLDRDLDYSNNFTKAKSNNEQTALVAYSKPIDSSEKKKYFDFFKFYLLLMYRLWIYFLFSVRAGLIVFFFSNFDNPKYFKLLQSRAHYIKWYSQYTALYQYKQRLQDWVKFFESFSDEKIFLNFKMLNSKILVTEPTNLDFLKDPYGRFWFQFPFTNHIKDFSYYTTVNLLETNYDIEDIEFTLRNGKLKLDPEKKIDLYQTDISYVEHGSDLTGMEQNYENFVYKGPVRFFTSDPTWSSEVFKLLHKSKLDKITSFPWYSSRTRVETVGSDFTYLDLIFVEDIPEDDEFIDEEADEDHPFYNKSTGLYNKFFEKNRYGANSSPYLPNDGTLDGFALEEVDWDIGSMVSFSSDDFNTHLEDFSQKIDLVYAALLDYCDLIKDYIVYYFQIKFKVYFYAPYKYWEISSNSNWLKISSQYGIWVLMLRNFFNISIFLVLAIYGYFTITRLIYFALGELFGIGINSFLVFFFTVYYFIFLLKFFFKSVNDFYKSIDVEEKLAFYSSLVIFFYIFNLNGYIRNPAYFAWTPSGSSASRVLLSNNFSASSRLMGTDWYPEAGFHHRPEINNQAWLFYKAAPIRPRYFYEEQGHKQFIKVVNPDRQVYFYNFNLASYPTYFNPYNIYNFIKFQIFNITNENFVGYTRFDRFIEIHNAKNNIDSSHTALHRPQIINWLHITTAESREIAKKEITAQGVIGVSSTSMYNYFAASIDRKKHHNIEFANPINQARVWVPYSPISVPNSTLPYDFRPKTFSAEYDPTFIKFNSRVRANYYNTIFNLGQEKINNVPEFIRRDMHIYKNQIDAEGDFLATAKTRKYVRSAYKSFGKKNFNQSIGLVDRAVKTRWIQNKLFSRNFLYTYSDNFRKYIFLYNPKKAKPLRDAYGLAFKDLVPYPEFLGHSKSKLAKFTKSKYFRSLKIRDKRAYFAILEAETFESAHNAIQHLSYFPKSGFNYNFYFDSQNSTRFELGYIFYFEYADIYESIVQDIVGSISPGEPHTLPRSPNFYINLKLPELLDGYHKEFRDFISNSRLERLNKLSHFFEDYIKYKKLRYKNYYYSGRSVKDRIQYEVKLANTNRYRRAKIISNYFRAIKAANKQSLADFNRESVRFTNPYKFNSYYINSSFQAYLQGINPKKFYFKNKIFDPYFGKKDKFLAYRSANDDRMRIYTSESDFINPTYDIEKRYNRRSRKKRFINKNIYRYSFGWYEYWYIEATFWNIFLDFIIVRDMLENADSISASTQDDHFDYKFSDYNSNPYARKFLDFSSKSSVVNINSLTEKKGSKKTFLNSYLREQKRIKNMFKRKYWPAEYEEDVLDMFPRYRYAERIGGIDRPPLKTNRFNFRKPHSFKKIRFEHWFAYNKEPTYFERQRKPYFGITTRDETEFYFDKKYNGREYDEFPAITAKHVLKGYIWFNTVQRSRMVYKTGFKKSFPYSQRFIKLFRKTPVNISNYISNFTVPIDAYDWKMEKDQYVTELPKKFLIKKKNPKSIDLFNKKSFLEENYDFTYKKTDKINKFERDVALKYRFKFFKKFLKDKKKYKNFHKRSYKFSRYFKNLQKRAGYDIRGQKKIIRHRDLNRYREYFFHGIIRSDEEKGEADIILIRAKKRKQVVLKNKIKNEKT